MIHPAAPGGPLAHLRTEIDRARGMPDATRPAVFVDGATVPQGTRASGRAAVLYTTNDKTLAEALSRVDVACLHLYECRASDLTPLAAHPRLTGLSIDWAGKVTDLEFLTGLPRLEALSLVDLSKVRDLTPLAALKGLEGLIIAGGMTKVMRVASLEAIGRMSALRELSLMSIRVDDPLGPRPLAACSTLRDLWLPNTFETADYAYLATRLPHTDCARFSAWQKVPSAYQEADAMVTGRRKPFLNSVKDAEKLARYGAEFEALKRRET